MHAWQGNGHQIGTKKAPREGAPSNEFAGSPSRPCAGRQTRISRTTAP